MALGTYTEGGIGSNASASVNSTSFTPAANSILIVFGAAYRVFNTISPPAASGGGLTYNLIGTATLDTGIHRISVRAWYAAVGGSPSSMQVTVSSTSASETVVQCSYVTGASTDFANVQTQTRASDGSVSMTLPSAPAASSYATLGTINVTNNGPGTPSGYSSFGTIAIGNSYFGQFYDSTSPGASAASSDGGATQAAAIMFEIKEAAAAVGSFLFPSISPAVMHMLVR